MYAKHHGTYGSPRITADLRGEGWRLSENTVAALMREFGLAARRRRRRRRSTRQGRCRWRAPDLIGRDFGTDRLNHKWYGDGTEIPTDEGRLYLDSVLDTGSRRIVGFAVGEHRDADLATAALQIAVAVRGGKDAPDAVIENSYSTLEFELRDLERFTTKAQARAQVAAWIEEYNHDRRRSSLGMLSPVAYELRLAQRERQQDPARASAGPSGMSTSSSAHPMLASSSPASRPRPSGGLRPALTPAAGNAERTLRGRPRNRRSPQNQVSTVSGDCRPLRRGNG